MKNENIYLSDIIKWHKGNNGIVENFGLSENHIISFPRAIDLCDESNISLLTSKYKGKIEAILASSLCKVIVIEKNLLQSNFNTAGRVFLFHENPKELIIKFCREFLNFGGENQSENIHPSAIIEKGAKVGKNVIIGANTYVCSDSEIGDYCTLGANNTIKNTSISNDVVIGSNNSIGECGFGYFKKDNGEAELFPHYGKVVIMNHVHIGNNTCIDRGSLSDTIIKAGVKVDNLVHIAHNVVIGENSFIIACSIIGGSAIIGKNCWVAPSSTIRNAITIGSNSTVGLASTVVKSVPNDSIVMGNPAISKDDFLKLRNHQKILISEQMGRTKNNKT